MSAWYIFTAMGFYPVSPGSDQYIIGAPYFPSMKVKVGEEKYLEINIYIQSMSLNGEEYNKTYLTYDDIKNGADIKFVLGSAPNKQWGVDDSSVAPSISKTGETMRYQKQ